MVGDGRFETYAYFCKGSGQSKHCRKPFNPPIAGFSEAWLSSSNVRTIR
jgi:hypothetical protein